MGGRGRAEGEERGEETEILTCTCNSTCDVKIVSHCTKDIQPVYTCEILNDFTDCEFHPV